MENKAVHCFLQYLPVEKQGTAISQLALIRTAGQWKQGSLDPLQIKDHPFIQHKYVFCTDSL